MSYDEQTPGERMDQREQHILLALTQDRSPGRSRSWRVSGLARDAEVQMQLAARMREARRDLGLAA
jgi:hypothetical protein